MHNYTYIYIYQNTTYFISASSAGDNFNKCWIYINREVGRGSQPELRTGTASCKVSLSLSQLDLLRSRWGYKYLTSYQFILVARYLICCTLVGFPIVISHEFNIVMVSYLIVQCGAPPVISWFITPIIIVISTISHSYWSYKPT